ncbi:acyltransferase [Kaistella daneshvariae]|uniref:Acyltransferase n=1 Tax=Kaistella daneshvariae TaxID=2487074 RepID=A0ABM7C6N6_9FLAO|nr:acyltransferase family protein [Kaistella daneshvariae]AZI66628.1 acyltransferase [Kaistella daneshvariae]
MINKKIFRYDISFLRFLAVTFVVLFHFKVPFFDGGFIGVDIFFVISGFLMTLIILSGIKEKKFNLIQFYKKRVERIIPAMLFLIIVLSCFSFFLLKEDAKQLFRYALSSELFLSNIFYLRNSGYFDNSSQNNALLHTWSLSVEWQFYIIYPLILIALRKIYLTSKYIFVTFFFTLTTLSFFLMLYYVNRDTSLNFYSLSTRAWEMLLGGSVFILQANYKNFDFRKLRSPLIVLCFGILGLSVFLIDESMKWPSAVTLLPVFATAFILYLSTDYKFYKFKIFTFIGDISYSLYLWHWPFFVFFQYFGVHYNHFTIIILIICSVSFASVSYYLIEKNKKIKNVHLILCALCILSLFHFFFIKKGVDLLFIRKEPQFKNNISWDLQTRTNLSCNMGMNGKGNFNINNCLHINKQSPNILLIGDSHAGALALSINDVFNEKGINLMQMTYTGNGPLYKRSYDAKKFQQLTRLLFDDYLPANRKDVDLIIISMYYSENLDLLPDLERTMNILSKLKIPVLIIGENETYKLNYEQIQKLNFLYPTIQEQNYLDAKKADINVLLKEKYGDDYLEIYRKLKTSEGDQLYMFDTNHFTKFGADQVALKIMATKQILNILN